ncbi:MAG: MFS transporter [Candidatus Obscuribacterales bacterium]|nr:MFS transporter [Candidatus Obscuribacterales bacterium]
MSTSAPTMEKPATTTSPGNNKSQAIAWVLYHFGNSGYPAVVAAAIFNTFFVTVIAKGAGFDKGTSTLLWTLAVGLSNLLVVVSAPLLGALCDYSAAKKSVLFGATIGCIILTSLLFFTGPGSIVLAFALITLSYFMFSTGENFLASFLPEICTSENMGRVSGWGCTISHLGALIILMACKAYVDWAQAAGQQPAEYIPMTAVLVAINYAVFGLPFFAFVKEHAKPKTLPAGQTYWSIGTHRLMETLKDAPKFQDLFRLLLTVMMYTCGTSTVVVLASVFAHEVMGFSVSDAIMLFIVINLTATGGAYVFGEIQDRVGSKQTLLIALSLWLLSVLTLTFSPDRTIFWIAASLAGAANGGSFTAGRATVGLLTPEGRAGEFFGLWGLACKTAAIIGPISYGLMAYATGGNHRLAIFCTCIFFGVALALATTINMKRGQEAARQS